MGKTPAGPHWFDFFGVGLPGEFQKSLEWLEQFTSEVEKIANFGCWTGREPFGLLWTLNATEIAVIEKNEAYLDTLRKHCKYFQQHTPERLEGRFISPIAADMTSQIPELKTEYYDLTYCDNVLYNMETPHKLQTAIDHMVGCVRPGGLVIAIEPKLGAEFEEEVDVFGWRSHRQKTMPKNITPLFEAKGLSVALPSTDYWRYCYRKRI
jgi:SAM-dependent methyltransferase